MAPRLGVKALRVLLVVTILAPNLCGAAAEFPSFKFGLSYQVVASGFEFMPQVGDAGKLVYRPSQSDYAGIILGYRWISGTLSFAVPANPEIRNLEGTSKYRDYRLSYYTTQIGAEAAYTRYLGYLIDNSSDLSAATLAGAPYYKIPELETLGYGVNLFYSFSKGGYSLAAAMDQSAIQEKSDGSWLLAAAWRHQAITSDSALIPTEKQLGFGADALISDAHTKSYAAGGGYGYIGVWNRWFASVMGALTAGYQSTLYTLANAEEKSLATVQANLHLRFGAGLNARSAFVVANFYFDRFGQETESIRVGNNVYGVTLGTGFRF